MESGTVKPLELGLVASNNLSSSTNPQPPSPVSRQLPSPSLHTLNLAPQQLISALSLVTTTMNHLPAMARHWAPPCRRSRISPGVAVT